MKFALLFRNGIVGGAPWVRDFEGWEGLEGLGWRELMLVPFCGMSIGRCDGGMVKGRPQR